MPEETTFLVRVWKDPVWSKVIAGVILAICGGFATYYHLDWWPTVDSWRLSAIDFAHRSIPVPYGFIAIGVVGIVGFVLLATSVIVDVLSPPPVTAPAPKKIPSWYSFKRGVFNGLRWRWLYYGDGSIKDLARFCTACDFEVKATYKYEGGSAAIEHECEHCGHKSALFKGDEIELLHLVTRQIEHQIRKNTWQSVPR